MLKSGNHALDAKVSVSDAIFGIIRKNQYLCSFRVETFEAIQGLESHRPPAQAKIQKNISLRKPMENFDVLEQLSMKAVDARLRARCVNLASLRCTDA